MKLMSEHFTATDWDTLREQFPTSPAPPHDLYEKEQLLYSQSSYSLNLAQIARLTELRFLERIGK